MKSPLVCEPCAALPGTSDVPEIQSDVLLKQHYTVNEISEEVRSLIATWERNLRATDYEPRHSPDQLRAMWATSVIYSGTDMPPPMRYRRSVRVTKYSFIG
jgi:hypothetical protein